MWNKSVQIRGGFSHRKGLTRINDTIQIEALDSRTRTKIINLFDLIITMIYANQDKTNVKVFIRNVYVEAYLEEVDLNTLENRFYYAKDEVKQMLNSTFREGFYTDVLDLIEYLYQQISISFPEIYNFIEEEFNNLFKEEYVGYRLVQGFLVQITDKHEIEEIELINKVEHDNVKGHIRKAILLLSSREKPDYENSIKESISAVEAMCANIVGKSGTLGTTISKIEEHGVDIHPALKRAFSALYGYTSDADGIRHAQGVGSSSSTFEEARFMLVSCSAFINYLSAQAKSE